MIGIQLISPPLQNVSATNKTLCTFSNNELPKHSRNIGKPGIRREQVHINTEDTSRVSGIHNEIHADQLHLENLLDLRYILRNHL